MMKKLIAFAAAAMLATASCAALAEDAVGMANPWTDVAYTETEHSFRIPDSADAASLVFRSMNEGALEEMQFTLNGQAYTFRAQDADELTDISGVYGEAEETSESTLGGNPCRSMLVPDGEEFTSVLLWYNDELGVTYSLTAHGKDVKDLDMFNVAAQCCEELAEYFHMMDAGVDDWSALTDEQATAASDVLGEYTGMLTDLQEDVLTDEEKEELRAEHMLALDAPAFGYCLKDMDGDGVPELIIAADANEDDTFYHGMILAMYRFTADGESELVLKSEERSRYYYAGDNQIAYEGSSSAYDSTSTTYTLEDGQLKDLGTPADHHENLAVVYLHSAE